jgi:hypothetical protein
MAPSVTVDTERPAQQVRAARCVAAAWDCQSHSFFGSPETVAANLANLPDELVQRRVYMLMVQGSDRGETRIYERFSFEDSEGTIATFQEESLGDLVTQIIEVLVDNKGVHCPGEQVKATLSVGREFEVEGPSPAPATAREAFSPALAEFRNESFVQASVMVLC